MFFSALLRSGTGNEKAIWGQTGNDPVTPNRPGRRHTPAPVTAASRHRMPRWKEDQRSVSKMVCEVSTGVFYFECIVDRHVPNWLSGRFLDT